MLVAVKTPHTKIEIKGDVPLALLKTLREEYGLALEIKTETDDQGLESVLDLEFYEEFKKRATPGYYVKIYRENLELTQKDLGEKIGHPRAYVCDIEKGRRNISKSLAKQLGQIFGVSPARFI